MTERIQDYERPLRVHSNRKQNEEADCQKYEIQGS